LSASFAQQHSPSEANSWKASPEIARALWSLDDFAPAWQETATLSCPGPDESSPHNWALRI
jgi:hypothetical protein